MALFSTNESIMHKRADNNEIALETDPEDVAEIYEIERCVEWVKANDFKKVCLQFPDYLLPDSCEVATRLQHLLGQTVYVMGDSAYESCCVDYITAQHVESDAIIHFGPKCFSKWTDVISYLCIYEKRRVDVLHLRELFSKKFNKEPFVIILDTPYVHKINEFAKAFEGISNVNVLSIDHVRSDAVSTLYVGKNDRKLMNFQMIFKPKELYCYDPEQMDPVIKDYGDSSAILKRRRFLIEKIKDSRTVGIIIATLVIKNYIGVIDRLKKLLKLHSKTYYVISVGRPTVAKLANFPEMDAYILICCSMSNIFDSRDFYKPIVTPHDVEVALNPNATRDFSFDFNTSVFDEEIDEEALKYSMATSDISLLSGKIRFQEECLKEEYDENRISVKSEGTVALNQSSGAGFLAGRTYKGLEQNLGQTEVKMAEEGRKGIAAHYANENF